VEEVRALHGPAVGRTLTGKSKRRSIMRITSKGQVTIPQAMREKAGLLPGTEVEFELVGDAVRIRPAQAPFVPGRGARIVELLRGSATIRMSTDEIMALTRGEE
jgi:AbrB family looped-hinge helix DNA binding protein